jgi:hypothetical protein
LCDGYIGDVTRRAELLERIREGRSPIRIARDPRGVQIAAKVALEWRNDHGPSCTCFLCVSARTRNFTINPERNRP